MTDKDDISQNNTIEDVKSIDDISKRKEYRKKQEQKRKKLKLEVQESSQDVKLPQVSRFH